MISATIKSNQCSILLHDIGLFFSYRSLVGIKTPTGYYVLEKGHPLRSRTTSKHITQWLLQNPSSSSSVHFVTAEELELLVGK